MSPKYSIIIATKDEEESIAKVLCSVPENISKHSEIIVVDSSKDYTPVIAKRLGAKIIEERGKGKGRAMRTGVKESKGEILIFLDGDCTDPPQYISKLLKKLNDSNLVLGCRSLKNFKIDDPKMRRIFKIYRLFVVPVFNFIDFRVSDPLAGFRAIRRKDWDKLNLKSKGFEIETEMNIKSMKLGFVIKEVPIPHIKRGGGFGKSKFVFNPKMWFKITNIITKYIKDEKMKVKVKKLKEKIKIKIKEINKSK